jgi:hypothetical protein
MTTGRINQISIEIFVVLGMLFCVQSCIKFWVEHYIGSNAFNRFTIPCGTITPDQRRRYNTLRRSGYNTGFVVKTMSQQTNRKYDEEKRELTSLKIIGFFSRCYIHDFDDLYIS